jgi:hypothetical protein
MDGVDDADDKCLYTPFSDLVDRTGCTIQSLDSPDSFTLFVGLSYSDTDYKTLSKTNTLTNSIDFNYYHKNFIFSLSSSYYSSDSQLYSTSGFNDTYLGFAYTLLDDFIYLNVAAQVILPSYETPLNNNNIDYALNVNLSYAINNFTFFGTGAYTLVNDDDIQGVVNYQNTLYLGGGLGYTFTNKLYASLLYSEADSIYKEVLKIKTASLYLFYSIDEQIFANLNYTYGLSDTASDNYFCVKLGYKF